MEKQPLFESAWARTSRDFFDAFHSYGWCSFGLAFVAIVWEGYMIVAPLYFIPANSTTLATGWIQAITFIGGMVIFLIIVFLVCGLFTPYRQRNEARLALEKLSQTPLDLECNSFEYSLVGKNWLQENQYIWSFNVILTNNSDKDTVGTKAISLLVNYSTPDGKVKSYALSLVPAPDRDKYSRPSMARGRLLAENEYLRPHEALTGFYQFLDTEAFWKPKLIQTWQTLVVVDSFGAPHRKQFSRSGFASRLNPDKEGSQT